MFQKARQSKHGGNNSILERWHKDAQYRKYLSQIGLAEEQIVEYDKIVFKQKRECQRLHDEYVTRINKNLEPIKSHRENRRLRPRQQIGTVTRGRREVGILGILHGLTIRVFSEFRASFGCQEMNFPITDGICEQNTHSCIMYRCAQCVSTSHSTV